MLIKRFSGKKIHGYLTMDTTFFDDITFLYGINGSGKTTLVRSVYALLAPSFRVLLETEFQSMQLEVKDGPKDIIITAENFNESVRVRFSGVESVLELRKFTAEIDFPPGRAEDARLEWFNTILNQASDHPVVRAIEALPTPMYLGIERRTSGPLRRFSNRTTVSQRGFSNTGSLRESLDEASAFAADAFATAYTKESELKDKLRNSLILRSFKFTEPFQSPVSAKQSKRKDELSSLERYRKRTVSVLSELGLSSDELHAGVEPFFRSLKEIIEAVPESSIKKKDKGLSAIDTNLLKYILNKWQFDRISEIADEIESFSAEVATIFASIHAYEVLINRFLAASKKAIKIGVRGLSADIENIGRRPIYALSSGEQQLVVLLTQLWFHPAAKSSNVLIIDEPELSLHLAWQEMFVGALRESGPNMQLILATHSPAIIGPLVENCQELRPTYA